jgi:tRNA (guanine-N7-)-methyltransferase
MTGDMSFHMSDDEGGRVPGMPKKRDFRQRAHCNPLSDRDIPYPLSPDVVDWTTHYPILSQPNHGIPEPHPTILDIGCGYGGLSFQMSKREPSKLVLGFEIRITVMTYVQKKVEALRQSGTGHNVSVQWANTMRTLMRYIHGNTIEKIFILFPDPHFKKRKAKWRIISPQLMDEYAFIMKPNALLYLVTDVQSYFEFAVPIVSAHPLFERLEVPEDDEVLQIAMNATEESRKVTRNGGRKFPAVFRRIPFP